MPDGLADVSDPGTIDEAHAAIAAADALIERLRDRAEQCRKLVVLGRIAAWTGAVLVPSILIGLLQFGPAALILAISAAIGGTVLAGTNRRTRDDLLAAVETEEARRAALIDALPLHEIGSTPAPNNVIALDRHARARHRRET